MAIEIRVLPVDQLVPAPYNPRRPLTAPARRKLQASLEAFGLVEPLVWNERTGHVVGGHARLGLLKEIGTPEVPVSVVRLTGEQERALNVVLNNQEAQGRFDPAKLADLLAGLADLPELELSGFDRTTLRALRLEPDPAAEPAPDPDRVEITIVTDPDTYVRMATDLDALVREYDVVTHVRAGHSTPPRSARGRC